MSGYPLIHSHPDTPGTSFPLGAKCVGRDFVVIAGPCAVESEVQLMETAKAVRDAGADVLRGSAYKPRTSPHDFLGLGEEGLRLLAEAGRMVGLPVITEVMDVRAVETAAEYADILQIGARNMYNYPLLTEIGGTGKPVLLKRAWSATVNEWLNAAEYIAAAGTRDIILCERGIRTYETSSRNTLDLNAVVMAKSLSSLPVFVDPSHGTGHADMVTPMSLAAVMAGCDGLEIEVHPAPAEALSDNAQQLSPQQFQILMDALSGTVAFRKRLSV